MVSNFYSVRVSQIETGWDLKALILINFRALPQIGVWQFTGLLFGNAQVVWILGETFKMKNALLASTLALFIALSASADEVGPCKQIKAACEAGGFVKGAHKTTGKGLYKDCLQKIIAGSPVEGVSVSAETIAACKAKKEKRAAVKQAKPGA